MEEDQSSNIRAETLVEELESLKGSLVEVEEKFIKLVRTADEGVRNRPYEFLGVALGLGIVLGGRVRRIKVRKVSHAELLR